MKEKTLKIILTFVFLATLGYFFNINISNTKAETEEVSPWCHNFTINLKYGDKGSEVQALQTALGKQGFYIGSKEKSDSYFGIYTFWAVRKFQEKYKEDILAPWGLKQGTGYVGITTRAKLNELYGCGKYPPRGIKGDPWADIIIGQPDFSEVSPFEVVPYKLFNPGGTIVDRSVNPGRLYVWDSGNSRILGLDLATCYSRESPCSADIVIGQPSGYEHSACNGDSGFQSYPKRAPATASTLCGIPEEALSIESKSFVSMFVDANGSLYVPDSLNHRILKYNSPFTTDTIADEVWGQNSFSGNGCNITGGAVPPSPAPQPTAFSLCFHSVGASGAGVTLDSAGNLWVSDGGNNRVLRFSKNSQTGKIAKTADLVLGQPDFIRGGDWSFGEAMDQMHSPTALRFDYNGKLYVVDTDNNRVLVFKPPFTSGMSASNTFGLGLSGPLGIEIDPSREGIWTYEHNDGRIKLWDFDGLTVKKELMTGQDGGGSLGIDANANILAPAYVYGQDVYRFSPEDGTYVKDRDLFSPPYIYNQPGPKGLRSGVGVEVAANQLIVADAGRILFWNSNWNNPEMLTNGKVADGVVAAPDFYTATYRTDCCGRLRADNANRLWVLAGSDEPEIRVYQLPLVTGAEPIKTLKFPFPVLGGGEISTTGDQQLFAGIAPVGNGEFVWISHPATNRVFRIRNPLSDPVVDVILGQTDIYGVECNRGEAPEDVWHPHPDVTADMLCWPGGLSLDRFGNLFVSDHALEVRGNSRLLVFDASLFPVDNPETIFAPEAAKTFLSVMPFEPAFDSNNRMVVGYNGYSEQRFVGIYNFPLDPLSTEPDAYLKDYWSMPYSITFDENDNLYVTDLNRGRVLIYLAKEKPKCQTDNDCFSEAETIGSELFCELDIGTCQAPGVCTEKPKACVTVYDPVCGCDEKTYSNDCARKIAGVSKRYDGECEANRTTSQLKNIESQLASISHVVSQLIERLKELIKK